MIQELLKHLLPVPKQRSTARIYKTDINKLLKGIPETKISDSNYKLVDVKQLRKFLRRNLSSARVYRKTVHDCDDFSFILMGDVTRWDSDLAFGIVWAYKPDGEYHALNVAIGTDRRVCLIEPQNDKVIRDVGGWDLRFVMM
ncbi:lectin MOA-related protein [Methanolobus sp. ZRKC3]|uniref:lectin MOA-related protein n=1 Tax=Methanolobus sp. ZRKC3 TaxID=3125786 RepID=UPI003253B7F1